MNSCYVPNKKISEAEYRLGIESIYNHFPYGKLPQTPKPYLILQDIFAMITSHHISRRTV